MSSAEADGPRWAWDSSQIFDAVHRNRGSRTSRAPMPTSQKSTATSPHHQPRACSPRMAAAAPVTTEPEHMDVFADFLKDPDWVIGVVVMPVANDVGLGSVGHVGRRDQTGWHIGMLGAALPARDEMDGRLPRTVGTEL